MVAGCRHGFVVLLAALVAGCTASSPAATDVTSPTTTSQTHTTAEEPETLAGFFGWEFDDPEAHLAMIRDIEVRAQETIRLCMARQGFDYLPMIEPEHHPAVVDEDAQEEPMGLLGLGWITWYDPEVTYVEDPWVDPNRDTVETMSEPERAAWELALYGSGEGDGSGCLTEGHTAEPPTAGGLLPDDLEAELATMNERIRSHPRIVGLEAEWLGCMAEAGYVYSSPTAMSEELSADFEARFEEIVGPDPLADLTMEEIDALYAEKSPAEIGELLAPPGDIDEVALMALQQEEADVAKTDAECAGEYWETYDEVRLEYEAAFIADNRPALEKIRGG